jgi:uncharacterized LabA/DUF88 family protein
VNCKRRAAVYIDGFNLYHAIHDLEQPHLKWLDLMALARSMLRKNEELVRACYFSAYATWLPGSYHRHLAYTAALQASGVELHMARFKEARAWCKKCGASWTEHEEKETDVHFALTILEDALDGRFERAIIVSADSDYVPAVKKVRVRCPDAEVFLAIPPKRYTRARDLINECIGKYEIPVSRLASCLLPERVLDANGNQVALRPAAYTPPRA